MKNRALKSFACLPFYLLFLLPGASIALAYPAAALSDAKEPPPLKEATLDENSNRKRAEKAFRDWQDGTGSITDLLADNLKWTIVGRSRSSRTYNSKKQFIDQVLQPFGTRFSQRFRPVNVRGVYVDGNTVIVHWDGEGMRLDGKPYKNTYAWFMRFEDSLVVEATAFYDSIAFNELWDQVTPK